MQYNFISNITSNGVKGSAILGIFSDLSVNSLSKSINATNLKKIKAAIKKSGFGGKINEKLCIYENVGSKFEKVYLIGLGDKKEYNEKKFIQAVKMFSKICKSELLENIYFDVNSFLSINIDKNWAIRNISIQVNGVDYLYNETKYKTKNR